MLTTYSLSEYHLETVDPSNGDVFVSLQKHDEEARNTLEIWFRCTSVTITKFEVKVENEYRHTEQTHKWPPTVEMILGKESDAC